MKNGEWKFEVKRVRDVRSLSFFSTFALSQDYKMLGLIGKLQGKDYLLTCDVETGIETKVELCSSVTMISYSQVEYFAVGSVYFVVLVRTYDNKKYFFIVYSCTGRLLLKCQLPVSAQVICNEGWLSSLVSEELTMYKIKVAKGDSFESFKNYSYNR